MAIKVYRTYPVGNMQLRSGRIYLFDYINFKNDPSPLVLAMNFYNGISPKTKKRLLFMQGINFHYLDISKREFVYKKWAEINKKEVWANKHFMYFWAKLQATMPTINFSVRRYLLYGNNIRNINEVSTQFMIEYFDNPLKALKYAYDVKNKVILAKKMRSMRIHIKKKK